MIAAWAAVLGTVAWNLYELRATLLPISYLDDASVHNQMVRFATARFEAGHDPLTSWFPYLQLGSPQFLHYQSLPAILTGLVGMAVGPNTAFRWSLYLLWCLWPIAIFLSARILRLSPVAAAIAATVSPLLASVPGVGYEQKAYVWIGYGVWTQLFASWTLPFAWAFTWRALESRRFIAPAVLFVMLTAAFHFETGYLALIPIGLLPFFGPGIPRRLARAAVVLVGSGLALAWVVGPLLLNGKWAAINTALTGGPLENGYGARQILDWLFTGRGFDNGMPIPAVSLLVAAGLVVSILKWRSVTAGRALIALLCLGLVLAFGRTTFGSLIDVIPGSTDVFFRRFFMAVQLSGIFLAGIGGERAVQIGRRLLTVALARIPAAAATRARWAPLGAAGLVAIAGCGYLMSSWQTLYSYDVLNSVDIAYQRGAQAADIGKIQPIIDYIHAHDDGYTYGGSAEDWGTNYTIGDVSLFKYLESQDVTEVGYTLRTAALMDIPEFHFDDSDPGDYALFGIRYLILPDKMTPPSGARLLMNENPFLLWELPQNGYIRVVDTIGTVSANRDDVGTQTLDYLRSDEPGRDLDLTVAWAGAAAAAPTLRHAPPASAPPPGSVVSEDADLEDGTATATVRLRREAVVVLAASYDPGWSVTVDGQAAKTEMVAPALVAVTVPAGDHTIAFRYVGFRWYPDLFALALISLAGLTTLSVWRRRDDEPLPPTVGSEGGGPPAGT